MTRRPWDHRGKSRKERGYGPEWDRTRKRILERDRYLCQPCLATGIIHPANEVDHRIAKARGGTDDDENLQAINSDCHKLKTAAEMGRTVKPKPGCDADGRHTDPQHPWNSLSQQQPNMNDRDKAGGVGTTKGASTTRTGVGPSHRVSFKEQPKNG